MKSFLFVLFLLPLNLRSQSDTLSITRDDLCPNLFQDSVVDSTYIHFYINNFKDTIYFNDLNCVVRSQLTEPPSFLWVTKNGFAHGEYSYNYWNGREQIVLKGEFSEGYFIDGLKEIYYETGELKAKGPMGGVFPVGFWENYKKDGTLNYRVQYFEYGYGKVIEVEEIRVD